MRSCTSPTYPGEAATATRKLPPADVRPLIEQRLGRSSYSVLRRVFSEQRGTMIRLSGSLPSHYLKQVAQSLVADIPGISVVINEIEVVAPRHASQAGGQN